MKLTFATILMAVAVLAAGVVNAAPAAPIAAAEPRAASDSELDTNLPPGSQWCGTHWCHLN